MSVNFAEFSKFSYQSFNKNRNVICITDKEKDLQYLHLPLRTTYGVALECQSEEQLLESCLHRICLTQGQCFHNSTLKTA